MAITIERVGTTKDILGEGPVWDEAEQALYWVDSFARVVHRMDHATGELRNWGVPEQIGSMALREGGGAVVAMETGFHFLDLENGGCAPVVDPEADKPRTRFNDGKVDRQGRFLAGTIMLGEPRRPRVAALHRLDPDLSTRTLDPDIALSNGPCFSPDGRTLYFADTDAAAIYAYDYDPATGEAANRRVHIDLGTEYGGGSDGATVDADGTLWTALVFASKIGRFDPDGRLMQTIDMPVQLPTSVMFGGPDLDELYVTSLSAGRLRPSYGPMDGALLRITGHGARGLPEPRFKG
ncbi:MAG: SMP-30/gluconolactonase/LRE family protein [Alphaproteobacteria bacterium]|nr:SMP-30/gluconolactonase/LRE family protein [Alphaproteobacteria bacterium]